MRVVKIGGNLADDLDWMRSVAAGIAAANTPTLLVHGGGKEVSQLQRAMGEEPEWRDGLRVTSPVALDAVRMVLSGAVNKRWTAALIDAGVAGMGISGEDAGLLIARISHGGALGRTGEVESVRTDLIRGWMAQGLTPVVSPVSRGPDGGGLNVNADDAAAAVASALEADELLFVSDVVGVRRRGEWIGGIDRGEADEMIASGEAAGGMRPKLLAALAAADRVAKVRIGDVTMLTDGSAGTRIHLAKESARAGS